jgi:hypothetical protein
MIRLSMLPRSSLRTGRSFKLYVASVLIAPPDFPHRLCDAFLSSSADGTNSVMFTDMFTSLPVVFVEQTLSGSTRTAVFNQNEFVVGAHVPAHFEIPGRLQCSASGRGVHPSGIVDLL